MLLEFWSMRTAGEYVLAREAYWGAAPQNPLVAMACVSIIADMI
jgi:hypothetical protein